MQVLRDNHMLIGENKIRYFIAFLLSSGPAIIAVELMHEFIPDQQAIRFLIMFLLMVPFSFPMYFLFKK